ncbi:PilZ domain-containing protein [Thiobaca trueperi]|uniref:PilZ domain-containing protein n=1 Tax=Thiobaca trueperi TaxID=127458 RepID=A0A4R3N683_9GAMM|nr:PilZ domain-containing protein [Thiobaca trueperi]TCT23987.1 PilZ domain-containing protein [Thiobaca trueperi]
MLLRDAERRDFKRLAAQTEATITRLTTGETLTAWLIDLSASGCAFVTTTAIDQNEEVEILVRSPSERIEPLRRSARIARVTPRESDYLIGVEFLSESV